MQFTLDPDVIFLNHGSFGACPAELLARYQQWQNRLESEPVRFLQRELPDLMRAARERLAEFVGAAEDEVVFIPNPTFGANTIARSLDLRRDDEILISDHEYGACVNAWKFVAEKQGARVVERRITLPVSSDEAIVEEFCAGFSSRTRLILLSQITSPTALTLPIAEICRRAAARGILTLIDGAHVPGQIDLRLDELGADFYISTCHKWMCAPKGTGFLYARRDRQALIEPLVVGWGWGPSRQFRCGSDFVDHHYWLGTFDPAAYLTVPEVIDWQARHDWPVVRERCHGMARTAVEEAATWFGSVPVHSPDFYRQMGLIELPDLARRGLEPRELQRRLFDEFRIEIPIIAWRDRCFARVSLQVYNTANDVAALIEAWRRIFPG